jgi:hypothetical protein
MGLFSFILEGLRRQCLSLAQRCGAALPWLVFALVLGIGFAAVIAKLRKHAQKG